MTGTSSVGGAETRPLNVTGCWVIRLFGAVVNPGAADAAQLATELSKLGADKVPFMAFQGANQSLVANGYQKLPGGMILQWGSVGAHVGTAVVTFPVAFPNFLCSYACQRGGAVSTVLRPIEVNSHSTTGMVVDAAVTDAGKPAFRWIVIGC